MELTKEIRASIDKSVLCWLATISTENIPNVSPKEIFTYYQKDKIIIANIASPQTVKNIKAHKNVCVSFIDILVQKGYQIKGRAEIINSKAPEFLEIKKVLTKMTAGRYPFKTVTKINIENLKPIIAPRYLLYPETTENEQIKSAKKAYGI